MEPPAVGLAIVRVRLYTGTGGGAAGGAGGTEADWFVQVGEPRDGEGGGEGGGLREDARVEGYCLSVFVFLFWHGYTCMDVSMVCIGVCVRAHTRMFVCMHV